MNKPLKLTPSQKYALELLENGDVQMAFTTPPEEQGNIVQSSYTCNTEFIYEQTTDRSDGSYEIVAYAHPRGDYDFEPWNSAPVLGRRVGVIERG